MYAEGTLKAHRAIRAGLWMMWGSTDTDPFAAFLVECGIYSISVSPDSFIAAKRHVAEAEAKFRKILMASEKAA